MRLFGQAGASHFEGRLCFLFAQTHFLQKLVERIERDLCIRRGVMHGYDDIRFEQAYDFRSFRSIEATTTPTKIIEGGGYFFPRPPLSACTPVMKTPPISNSPGLDMTCDVPLTESVLL